MMPHKMMTVCNLTLNLVDVNLFWHLKTFHPTIWYIMPENKIIAYSEWYFDTIDTDKQHDVRLHICDIIWRISVWKNWCIPFLCMSPLHCAVWFLGQWMEVSLQILWLQTEARYDSHHSQLTWREQDVLGRTDGVLVMTTLTHSQTSNLCI